MLYSVSVPEVGTFYINAGSPYDAALLMQARLRQLGVALPAGALIPAPEEVISGAVPANTDSRLIIGNVRTEPVTSPQTQTGGGSTGTTGAGGSGKGPAVATISEYIVRITHRDGFVEYFRYTGSQADAYRLAAERYNGTGAVVSGANTPDYFDKNDPEFRERAQAAGGLGTYVSMLERLTTAGSDEQQDEDGDNEAKEDDWSIGPASPSDMPLIAKVTLPDGSVRFVTVNTKEGDIARAAVRQRFGPDASILIYNYEFFRDNTDPDFQAEWARLGAGQQQTWDQFISRLESVSTGTGNGGGGAPADSPGDGPPAGGPAPELPFDIQYNPYANFQNAVRALGYDPNGVIGGLLGQRFNDLSPAYEIGSLTGTFNPIGNAPGALQGFFESQFGNLGLAEQVLRDLIAGNAASGLAGTGLIALQNFINPDLTTQPGRSGASLVLDLAQAAAANRFGSFVARNLLPSNQRLLNEYDRLIAAAGGPPEESFLDFARRQSLLPAQF